MAIKRNDINIKSLYSKGCSEEGSRAGKIDTSTIYGTCSEQISTTGRVGWINHD